MRTAWMLIAFAFCLSPFAVDLPLFAAGTANPIATEDTRSWKFIEPEGVYKCALPQGAVEREGVIVLPKNYLDDVDPQALPAAKGEPRLELFAAPGETEPATFLIVAARPLANVDVRVSDIVARRSATESATASRATGGKTTLPARAVTVRRVVRTPMRRLYPLRADQTEIVSRFLPRWQPLTISANEFREVWLSFDVPPDQPPGDYTGKVTITHAEGKAEVPLLLEVLPIRLIEHPRKQLACYYRLYRFFNGEMGAERVLRELRDMHAHGVRHLVPGGVGILYRREGERIVADFSRLREGLDLIRQAGFRNATIVVGSGMTGLDAMVGKDVPLFLQSAKQGMEEFLEFAKSYPEFRLVVTHMDEVFNENRLPRYIRLSQAVRQVPQIRLYITFHTLNEAADEMRQQIDPFVDLRCNHGYTFEWWLTRGHTMEEYERELERSGDEAWFYHNARGVHFTAEWSRIINGVYLWASPFSAHCPWCYQAYHGNPFDDTDGPERAGHDFGMSFPGIEDPADLVPTRLWEAMREGGDDLRYLATLEAAIAAARGRKAAQAKEAAQFLDRVKGLIRKARTGPAPSEKAPAPAGGAIDLDTGLVMGQGVVGSSAEAPLINALAQRFSGDDWQRLRRQVADWIVRLQFEVK